MVQGDFYLDDSIDGATGFVSLWTENSFNFVLLFRGTNFKALWNDYRQKCRFATGRFFFVVPSHSMSFLLIAEILKKVSFF